MDSEDTETRKHRSIPARFNPVFLNLTLLVAATLVSLLFAEIGIRAFGVAPALMPVSKGQFRVSTNPRIAYEPIANIEYKKDLFGAANQYLGVSNRFGFRGPAYPEEKPSGVYRIAVLGDSITEGLGIDHYEELFTGKVERALRDEGMDAEVFNFGASGYNTQQEVETLKAKGLGLEPDLVILAYCLNDTAGPSFWILKPLIDGWTPKGAYGGFLVGYLVRSALYRVLRFRLLAPTGFDYEQYVSSGYATGNTVAEYVKELGRLSRSHDFQVLVVVFPFFTDRTFMAYEFQNEHDMIRTLAEEQNFLILDLLPVYAACVQEDPRIFRDNLHPNKRGHTCAASAISEFLLKTVVSDTSSRRL
jgi:lysophospholipase L1-like esterase